MTASAIVKSVAIATPVRLLGLCGSLRDASICAGVLRAMRAARPAGVDLHLFGEIPADELAKGSQVRVPSDGGQGGRGRASGLGGLPLFNPDFEADPPPAVRNLWAAVDAADAVVIVSPEYAHGVTGVLKNALDWLVGHAPFAGMPVSVINPAPDSRHADESLKEILRTMSADLIPDACLRIPAIGAGLDPDRIADCPELRGAIAVSLDAIARHVQARKEGGDR